jgi:hypothetical protein
MGQLQFERMRCIGCIDESEHPNRAGQHVRGALGICPEIRTQVIVAKRCNRALDHLDPSAHAALLALPN